MYMKNVVEPHSTPQCTWNLHVGWARATRDESERGATSTSAASARAFSPPSLHRRQPPASRASRSMLANEKRRRVFFRRFARSLARSLVRSVARSQSRWRFFAPSRRRRRRRRRRRHRLNRPSSPPLARSTGRVGDGRRQEREPPPPADAAAASDPGKGIHLFQRFPPKINLNSIYRLIRYEVWLLKLKNWGFVMADGPRSRLKWRMRLLGESHCRTQCESQQQGKTSEQTSWMENGSLIGSGGGQ